MIAALFDIHGNLPALEAVLSTASAAGAERLLVGGDVVDGPLPRQTLDRLLAVRPLPLFLRGNTERALVPSQIARGEAEAGRPTALQQWVAAQLTQGQLRFLAELPRCIRMDAGAIRLLFCHATPRSDRELFTPATPPRRLRSIFEDVDADVVVCGHTHIQFDIAVEGLRIFNAGSVGMPTGEAVAQWALIDDSIRLMRTPYDLEAAKGEIGGSGYPGAARFIEENLERPYQVASAVAYFEARASEDPRRGAEPPGWG
ncbi:MAG: metallophosphoesterase family protein [Candidatus Dormibacteraeota bacterium]|nr:metallophosphoesterase family protein [Candidatus Dormibacteraeota bacterium]